MKVDIRAWSVPSDVRPPPWVKNMAWPCGGLHMGPAGRELWMQRAWIRKI